MKTIEIMRGSAAAIQPPRLTWLYNSINGSILMTALFHGTLNFVTAPKASEDMIATVITMAIMIGAVLVILVYKPANLASQAKQEL